jgi:hypothetical protein
MKLSGQILIDLPAGDYLAIADHRKRLEDILAFIRDSYPGATLVLKEKRQRTPMSLELAPPRAPTGALNAYAAE